MSPLELVAPPAVFCTRVMQLSKEDASLLLVGAGVACIYSNQAMSYVEWSGSRFSSESWCAIGLVQLLVGLVIYFWSVFNAEPAYSRQLRLIMVLILLEFVFNEAHAGSGATGANIVSGVVDEVFIGCTLGYVLLGILRQPEPQQLSTDV